MLAIILLNNKIIKYKEVKENGKNKKNENEQKDAG